MGWVERSDNIEAMGIALLNPSYDSPPRMMLRMQLLQPLPRHMRVNLRRRNIRMTQ